MITISERISYLPAEMDPLSSDVGFVHGDEYEWIFDVGCSDAAVETIQGIRRKVNVVISHFHQDHTGNLDRISYNELYCGGYTYNKFRIGTAVREPCTFEDGCKITVFPIPCSHAKGALGLEIDEKYAFIGDAVYSMAKEGRRAYNVGLLKETIRTLSALKAEKLLVSHDKAFIRNKADVLDELNRLYNNRISKSSYIFL